MGGAIIIPGESSLLDVDRALDDVLAWFLDDGWTWEQVQERVSDMYDAQRLDADTDG